MKQIDRIHNMNAEEMAKNLNCDCCLFDQTEECFKRKDKISIKEANDICCRGKYKFLESEVEE